MKDKKTAIGYVRVSTQEQANDGYSLDNQRNDIIEKCKREGIELIEIFSDDGVSGASLEERYGLAEAMQFTKREKIDYFIIWKQSRLSRDTADSANIIKYLEWNGTCVLSIKDSIDTSTDVGKSMAIILSTFAEMERKSIIAQAKGGMLQRARKGEWNGGPVPLGYKNINKELYLDIDKEKNIDTTEVVKLIFSEYIKGNGYKAIARMLNENGYKTSRGKNFSGNSIKDILTNPIYSGKIRWGKLKDWGKKNGNGQRRRDYNEEMIFVNGCHEAIIDIETFEKVQKMIEGNPRHGVKQFNGNHVLSGLLRCPDCGYGMSILPITSKGRSYEYYSCNQNQNKQTCKSNLIPKNNIEEEFFKIFEKIVNEQTFKEKMGSALSNSNWKIMDLEKAIKRKEKEVIQLESDKDKLLMKIKRGDELLEETYTKDLEKTVKAKQGIEIEIKNLKLNIDNVKARTVNINDISQVLNSVGKVIRLMDGPAQKRLIRKLIKEIKVKEKHISEICFSFEDGFRVESDTGNRTISNRGF